MLCFHFECCPVFRLGCQHQIGSYFFPACDKQIDLIFAVDASGSIEESDFQRILNFARDLVGQMEVDTLKARIGFVVYSDTPEVIFHLDTYTTNQEMSRAIVGTKYLYGHTNTAAMLEYVRETMFSASHGRREGVDSVLVVVTDGGSDDPTATIDEARKTRNAGIDILAMGIGDSVRVYELEGMASHPKTRNVFRVEGYQFLFQATDVMRSTMCDGQLLRHSYTFTSSSGRAFPIVLGSIDGIEYHSSTLFCYLRPLHYPPPPPTLSISLLHASFHLGFLFSSLSLSSYWRNILP